MLSIHDILIRRQRGNILAVLPWEYEIKVQQACFPEKASCYIKVQKVAVTKAISRFGLNNRFV